MTKEELEKYVEHEIQWFRGYGYRPHREALDLNSEKGIYEQVSSIGYAKVETPLDIRCMACALTADEPITKDTPIESLSAIGRTRNHKENRYTPLEFWIMKFPEDRERIKQELLKINK